MRKLLKTSFMVSNMLQNEHSMVATLRLVNDGMASHNRRNSFLKENSHRWTSSFPNLIACSSVPNYSSQIWHLPSSDTSVICRVFLYQATSYITLTAAHKIKIDLYGITFYGPDDMIIMRKYFYFMNKGA